MIGLKLTAFTASVVKSIVKKALQAWYKADNTQAPLGEEEIANGSFATGPELVNNNNWSRSSTVSSGSKLLDGDDLIFPGDSNTAFTPSQSGITLGPEGFRFVTQGTSSFIGMNAGAILTEANSSNATVAVTYTILQSNRSNTLSISNASDHGGDVHLDTSVGTHTLYFTPGRNDLLIKRRGDDIDVTIANVSVKQTNPNDSWAVGTGWAVEDGTATCSSENANLTTDVSSVAGKIYKVTVNVTRTSGLLAIDLGGSDLQSTTSSGVQTFTIKAVDTGHLRFYGGAFRGSLSNISVKEITNSVKDFSPNNNNGVLYSGKALSFDGTGDKINLNYWKSETINDNTKATFTCWINADDATSEQIFLGHNQQPNSRFYLAGKNDVLDLGWGISSWNTTPTAGALPTILDNTWYRIVAVIEGKTCKVFMNGEYQFEKTNTNDFTTDTDGLYFGSHGDGTSYDWTGKLADFQIYDKAWTPSDVKYDWENPDKDVFDDEGRTEVLGEELIVGGVSSTGSWGLAYPDTTVSVVDGILRVSPSSAGAYGVRQTLTTKVGAVYKITATVNMDNASSGSGNLKISNDSNLGTGTTLISSSGSIEAFYTATNATTYIGVADGYDAGVYMEISAISVKEITTHAGEISPTDCVALYRLNEGAGDRVYNAAPVLGEELVVDGSWDPDGSTNWSDVNNILTSDGNNGAVKNTDGSLNVSQYKYYRATFEILERTAGSVRLYSGAGADQASYKSTVGVHTYVFESLSTNLYLYSNGFNGSISNVSFKEITLPNSYVLLGNPTWATAQPYIPQYAMSSYSKKAIFGGAGSGDLIDCGKEDSIDNMFVGGGTWSAWISAVSASGDKGTILSKSQPRLRVRDDDGDDITLEFLHTFSGTNGVWRSPTTALLENKLNHVAVSYNNTDTANDPKIYINGVKQSLDYEVTPIGSADTDAGSEFRIGSTNSTVDPFDGFIDEVAVFDKILTEDEVQEIFNAGIALDCRDHSAYLGSELVTDTDLNDSTYWTEGTYQGSAYTPGVFVFSNSGLNIDSSKNSSTNKEYVYINNFGTSQGDVVLITFTISNYVSGEFRTYLGQTGDAPPFSGNGTYTYVDTADISQVLYLQSNSSFIGTISSISVKKVDLKGYWRNNGTDTWTDLSPYGNNGTVSGSPTTIQLQEVPYFKKDTFGLPMNRVRQKGLNLDGDSYIKIDDDSSLGAMDDDDGFTCAFWYRHFEDIDTSNYSYLVAKGTGLGLDVDYGFAASVYNNKIYADLNTSDARFSINHPIGAASSSSPVWYYITATYNGSDELELYVDAVSIDTRAVTGSISATAEAYPITIGTDKNYYSGRTRSVVDEVKWYNRALSLSEIEKNHKATKSKHSSTSSWSDDFSDGFI